MRGTHAIPTALVGMLLAACSGGGPTATPSPVTSVVGQATAEATQSGPAPSAAVNTRPVCKLVDTGYYNQLVGATQQSAPATQSPETVCYYEYTSITTRQWWSVRIEQSGSGGQCSGSATTENIYFVVTPRTTASAWRLVTDDGDTLINGTVCSPKYLVNVSIANAPNWGVAKMRDHLLEFGKKVERAK